MCFIFHSWGKWEQYKWSGTIILGRIAPKSVQGKKVKHEELRQRRACKKCNKMQDEEISG